MSFCICHHYILFYIFNFCISFQIYGVLPLHYVVVRKIYLHTTLHKKTKFFIKDFFSKCNPTDLVTLTEEIHNGKLYFLCSATKDDTFQPVNIDTLFLDKVCNFCYLIEFFHNLVPMWPQSYGLM